jgi:hypothetical protein
VKDTSERSNGKSAAKFSKKEPSITTHERLHLQSHNNQGPEAYIGQSVDLHRREIGHGSDFKAYMDGRRDETCTALYDAMNKYGPESFKIKILIECDHRLLDEMEQYFILTHNTLHPNGLNLTTGGKSGYTVCELTRERIRQGTIMARLCSPDKYRSHDPSKGLPKHMSFMETYKGNRKAFNICRHPLCLRKVFPCTDDNIDTVREEAIAWLQDLERDGVPYKPEKRTDASGEELPRGIKTGQYIVQVSRNKKPYYKKSDALQEAKDYLDWVNQQQ